MIRHPQRLSPSSERGKRSGSCKRSEFVAYLDSEGALLIADATGNRRDVSWRLPIAEVFDQIVAGLADNPGLLEADPASTAISVNAEERASGRNIEPLTPRRLDPAGIAFEQALAQANSARNRIKTPLSKDYETAIMSSCRRGEPRAGAGKSLAHTAVVHNRPRINMARIAQFVVRGLPHHFTPRGARCERVFFGEDEYELDRDLLASQTPQARRRGLLPTA